MRLVHKDLKHGEIKLVPENLDDIWHLYNIIDEGDLVRAVTFRTSEQKDDKIRSKKTEKKRMKLGIRVKEVKFHEFSDRLRVLGVIEEGPQNLGSYHTFNIEAEQIEPITIVKEEWKDHQLKRIEEAVKLSYQPIVVFVSLDDDSATVAVLRQSGVQWIADIDSKRSGKMYESEDKTNEYYGEIISLIKNYKKKDSPLVVVGPGFTKEHLIEYGKNKDKTLFEKCYSHGTSTAGMNGVQEAIKTGVVEKITKENRVVFETKLVEKLFEEIKKDGLATYGEKEVTGALNSGAVERLLVSDFIIRTTNGEELLKLAKKTNSEFTIINSMNEAGKKLEGLGGIAALLRFKI
ncbi:MAG: mRNA surveillance protein pelota [Candidatus Thermoplasmatota archaeon]|nr:mRNA surveillance protein pelota [Candidatus Thermoplasmatota archaeon]